jgi:Na+/H+ antiporter NhaD/arsenite permease-like protein
MSEMNWFAWMMVALAVIAVIVFALMMREFWWVQRQWKKLKSRRRCDD